MVLGTPFAQIPLNFMISNFLGREGPQNPIEFLRVSIHSSPWPPPGSKNAILRGITRNPLKMKKIMEDHVLERISILPRLPPPDKENHGLRGRPPPRNHQ